MSFERPNIRSLHGYVPGEQPDSGDVIKLNTNENPYPAPAAVAEALAAIDVAQLRRYPPPTARGFRQAVADRHGLKPDNVIPTNGGDELLRLAITTFAGAGDAVGIAVPSYSLYPVLTEIQGCKLVAVALNPDWTLPQDFAVTLNRAGVKLAMLVNPHAPTGLLTPMSTLVKIAESFDGVLLVDEAYVDFVDPEQNYSLIPLLNRHRNLLLLRTLSKGYSLAGLRVGYGLGHEELIAPMLFKTRDSYNTDLVAQKLAEAAIGAADAAEQTWKQVRADRRLLSEGLLALGFACLPSQTNFILATVPSRTTAADVYQGLKQRRILVRYFEQDRLRDKLRITVGTPEQNRQLLKALAELLA